MEYSDYLDNSKLSIKPKKGLNDTPIVRFGVAHQNIIYPVDLNHENVLKVINELNEIIEGDGN